MWDEGPWWYAAPVSALSVNDNCIDFYIEPGKVGRSAKIDHFPKTSYITFENNSITVDNTLDFKKIEIDRDWVSNKNNFTVTGEILNTTTKDTLFRNIYDPSLFTGTIFKELLKKHGTQVKQLSAKPKDLSDYKEIANHKSDSLIVSAKNLMNSSDNLTAELFVKSIGALDSLPGTWKTGLDSVKSFLAGQVKIDTSQIRLADGSGVSRYTLTNSDQLIYLGGLWQVPSDNRHSIAGCCSGCRHRSQWKSTMDLIWAVYCPAFRAGKAVYGDLSVMLPHPKTRDTG